MSCITVQNPSEYDQTHSFSPCYRPAPAAVHTLVDDSINQQGTGIPRTDKMPVYRSRDPLQAHSGPQKNITGITIQMRTRNRPTENFR